MAAGRIRAGGRLALGARLEVIRDRGVKCQDSLHDMPIIDKVFEMEGGYVLDFSNRTFAEFFQDELDINIDDSRWAAQGESKAKRLRYYLRQADRETALDTLNALWEYRVASSVTADYPILEGSVREAYFRIIKRLEGKPPEPAVPNGTDREQRVDRTVSSALAARLIEVSTMDPPGSWLRLREVPEGCVRHLWDVGTRLLPSQGRADRRQFRTRRTDVFARSEMEEREGRRGDASRFQRQG